MIRRYWRVVAIQLRISAASAMAYRANFLLEGFMTLAWMFQTLLPLFVVFSSRDTVAGWDIPSTLIIIAYFTAVHAVLEGIISPSARRSRCRENSAMARSTTCCSSPIDAQGDDVVIAARAVEGARSCSPRSRSSSTRSSGAATLAPADVALGIVMFFAGVAAMYAVFVVCAAASFWIVRLDNLVWLIDAVFDAARWPIQVFRGAWRFLFTFVVPLPALMTTFPAMAQPRSARGGDRARDRRWCARDAGGQPDRVGRWRFAVTRVRRPEGATMARYRRSTKTH